MASRWMQVLSLLWLSSRANVDTNFDSGAWSILPVNMFILDVYLVSLLLNSFLRVSCLITILMAPQFFLFVTLSSASFLSSTEVQTDCDDHFVPQILTTLLTCTPTHFASTCCLNVSCHWFSQLVCWNTVDMIENQFNTRVSKSEHTMNVTAVFRKTECNGISLTRPMLDLSVVLKRTL